MFLAGGVVIGTVAFRSYANMLGLNWHNQLQTCDIDQANDDKFPIIIPRDQQPVNLLDILLNSGLGFLEAPTLNPNTPSTGILI